MENERKNSSNDSEENKSSNTSFAKSQFSASFNILVYFGVWPLETSDVKMKKLYKMYQLWMISFVSVLVYYFFVHLHKNFGNIKEMSWNICVNSNFTGSLIKSGLLYYRSNAINDLRRKLHKEMESRTDEEDIAIHRSCISYLGKIKKYLYICGLAFGAVWQVSRYMSKYTDEKMLPVPFEIPFEVDLDSSINFDVVFVVLSSLAAIGLFYIIHQELSMYSLLLQLKREYEILLKDLLKFDTNGENMREQEGTAAAINPYLQRAEAKALLREFFVRQKKVMRYAEMYENCFNKPMVCHFSVITLLTVSIGLQCVLFSPEFVFELWYQIGYGLLVLSAFFLQCYLGTVLNTRVRCREVGHLLYSSSWYTSDPEMQRDLKLMVLISQRPPRITCLRSIDIDLTAFMAMMNNTYGWMACFRQVALKNQ